MKVHDVEQRSESWRQLRVGRLCASRAHDMMAQIKTGEAAARRNLRVQLVLERITNRGQENGYVSPAMQNGIDREPEAVALYEAVSGNLVERVGFVSHDTLMAGASPDGVIGEWEGIAEVKSPLPATHLEYLTTGVVPRDYMFQVVHQLWLTGAQWCDWLSYQPDFPEPLQVKVVRVQRDEAAIKAYALCAELFLKECAAECEKVSGLLAKATA